MSAPSCGYCGVATLNGSLCKTVGQREGCWEKLQSLLRRCAGLDADLASAVEKRGRFGEETRSGGSVFPGLPVNFDAADARRELFEALTGAWRGLGAPGTPPTVDHAAGAILGRPRAVLGCSVGPVLLGDLAALVPEAVRMTDRPASRLTVRVPCPRCGGGPLEPVMGALRCRGCRETSTVGEVRAA